MPKKRQNYNPNQHYQTNPSFTADGLPVPSAELPAIVRDLQEGQNKVLLSFSGKDSLAAWLFLREQGFEVVPYFCYSVPGLSYDDEALAYYEDFFQTKIYRFLHPASWSMLWGLSFQPPDTAAPILRMHIPGSIDFAWLEQVIIDYEGLRPDTFIAVGIRAADNLMRNRLVHQMGPLGLKKRRYWWAVWDFKMDDTLAIIRKHGVKLSRAYRVWGSTGDVYDYPVLKIMRDQLPADFEKVKQMFPLIEAEFYRYEQVK